MTIPKKPVAVSRVMKKLPLELDWGKGIPKDRLRYINAREEALIKANRSSTADRSHMGVKAYADDSASSKGVSRGPSSGNTTTKSSSGAGKSTGQGGQGRGPSGAGQGPNSASAGSRSPSAGSRSPSGGQGGSKSPNAAAQAASNRMNGISGAARPSIGGSRSPNMAAGYASQKLNATAGALKTAQNPRTVSGMLNSQSGTATQWGGADPRSRNAAYPSRGDTPGTKPTDKYNTPNWGSDIGAVMRREAQDIGVPNAYVDNSPQRFHDYFVGTDADPGKLSRFTGRTPAQISEMARTTYGEAANQGPMGMAAVSNTMENRLKYGSAYGSFGRGDVSRMLSKFDANGYDYGVREGVPQGGNTAYQNATAGTEGMTNGLVGMGNALDRYSDFNMSAPDAVKNATHYYNPKDASPSWGKGFTAYGDHVFGNPDPGPTEQRIAGLRENGGFGSTGLTAATKSPLDQAMESWNPPKYTGIPAPVSTGMLPGSYPSASQALPSVESLMPPPISRPQGPLQPQGPNRLASQNMQTPPGWGNERVMGVENYVDTTGIRDPQAAMGPSNSVPQGGLPSSLPGFTPQGLPSNFRGTPGVASTGRVPGWGYSPSADYSTPSPGPSVTADNTDSYSPQAGPGEQDVPYSDSPVQGSQNPMQEGPAVEDPGIRKARQQKYASTGATVGSVIAGPIGAVIGGTLGWQMGKTTPGQRKAIASNPKAIAANVQSINTMVEERGGKGNPDMHVTDAGFRDVLTNPANVTANPQQYTSLEQMLAQLAQGIDPETGKKL